MTEGSRPPGVPCSPRQVTSHRHAFFFFPGRPTSSCPGFPNSSFSPMRVPALFHAHPLASPWEWIRANSRAFLLFAGAGVGGGGPRRLLRAQTSGGCPSEAHVSLPSPSALVFRAGCLSSARDGLSPSSRHLWSPFPRAEGLALILPTGHCPPHLPIP